MPDRSLLVTLAVFLGQCLVFSGAGVSAQIWRRRLTGRGSTALEAILLGALAPCVLGYLAFAAYFAHPLLGRTVSWLSVTSILATLAHAYLLPLLRRPFTVQRSTFKVQRSPLSVPHAPSPPLSLSPTPRLPLPALHTRLLALPALAGLFYLSVLFIFPLGGITNTAGQRFYANMPGDNFIPTIFAERLHSGVSPKAPGGDWLSSDRPPLQSGLALVTLPALRALDIGYDKACATAGVWFQLLWIPALWVFLRWLGLTERDAHAATAALVFTGFLLFNSVFVWPKLAGAALVLLAFCTFFATESAIDSRHRWLAGGTLVALGSLAHGGVLFSLLALAPLVLLRVFHSPRSALNVRRSTFGVRPPAPLWRSPIWRDLLLAALAFTVLSLPWFAYQRLYEPPGNRLIKWHVGGAIAPDSRSITTTLLESYRAQGWARTLDTRRANLRLLFRGDWPHLLTTRDRAAIAGRRGNEIFHPFRTAATWILGAAALPFLAFIYLRRRPAWRDHVRRHGQAVAWLVLTLALWLALMFFPDGTMVHQGSYVVPLLLFGLLTAWTLLLSRRLFAILALLQLALFTLTWMPPNLSVTAVPHPFAIATAALSALVIVTLSATALRSPSLSVSPRSAFDVRRSTFGVPSRPPFSVIRPSNLRASVPLWFKSLIPTTLTPAVLVALAVALFLRKPYALLVPQLYAEDGTIFLAQNDLVGLRALLEPYMGYLHTLPRLIAWLASQLLDPAWWPAFYNLTAFSIWLAVIARTFSPRLPLPPALRPWLALAFFLGPQTGEVLFSITNLQWVVAFLLVQQAFLAPPTTTAQRVSDLALLALLGLTGPFILALGPLLAWRTYRDLRAALPPFEVKRSTFDVRRSSTRSQLFALSAPLLVATACAATQAWFIVRTGPHFTFPPFDAAKFFSVVGQHLLVWPVLGDHLARQLSPFFLTLLGIVPVFALLAWSLRPHPRRLLRAQLVAAFVLMMAAGVYRARPDTWNLENLVFGDRYFYLPRVLLAWLLILELDTAQRAIRWTARALLLACALVHLKGYTLPPEPNYHWTEHVDPIRRGVPANLPTLPEGWTLEYRGRPK